MEFYIIDCFAEEKYQGNELLVLKTDRFVSDEEQQLIAREINFSETAFTLSDKKKNGGYDVRIWTPNVGEVPFAGHPSLGTAFVIREFIENDKSETVKLNLKVGQIPVSFSDNDIKMSQNAPEFGEIIAKEEIAEAFGITEDEIRDDFPCEWVSTGLEAVLIPLKSRESLKKVIWNKETFKAYIGRHPKCNCNHLFFVDMGDNILHARCLMEDFVEDPATGSANGDLAGYMIKNRFFDKDEVDYTVIQGEDMGRKSIITVHAKYDKYDWLIEVGGSCKMVASGVWE